MKWLLVVTLLLSGCSLSLGLAVHSGNNDRPEVNLNNPLGVIRLETKYVECQHVSGLVEREQGYGLTMCGPSLIKIKEKM